MPTDLPSPRKRPLQRRAIATCDAIVEAAARILETAGESGLTTNRVAERAGVSVGTLYQYYPDKHAILVDLIRRERALLIAALQAIPAEEGDPLRAMVAASIRHQFARPALARALERIETAFPLDAEADEMARDIARLAAALLVRAFGARRFDDLLTAVVIGRALINAAGAGLLPADDLSDRVIRAVSGYLEAARTR